MIGAACTPRARLSRRVTTDHAGPCRFPGSLLGDRRRTDEHKHERRAPVMAPAASPWGVATGAGGTKTHRMSLPADLIAYLGSLVLSGGDHDGEAFRVLPWEARFVRGAFGQPGHAALSVARGNGKSALVAGIAAAVVDPAGPLHGNRRECVAVASSFDQSRIIFEDVLAFLRARYDLTDRKEWRLQDSANRAIVEYRPTGARVRTIGSDPSKAHGLRPALALIDEPAQHDAAKTDRMLAAIRTGLGKTPGSKMIALGTRPALDSHWFARTLDGSGVGYAQVHAARPGDAPFQVRTMRRANPSMTHLPSLAAELRAEAADARRDESLLAAWRALRLNGGVHDVRIEVLIGSDTWARHTADAPREGRPVWGLDLGQSEAMAAVASYWPATGRLEAVASFPTVPTLAERGLQDGVAGLYVRMSERGDLVTTGGEAIDVAALLREAWERYGPPSAVAADRWRVRELADILNRIGLPRCPLHERGQGYMHGGEDVRDFRRAMAEGKVRPVPSLLLSAAMSEARTVGDPAGNWKLAKSVEGGRRRRAKDDAAAAAILAVAIGSRVGPTPPRRWRYRGAA